MCCCSSPSLGCTPRCHDSWFDNLLCRNLYFVLSLIFRVQAGIPFCHEDPKHWDSSIWTPGEFALVMDWISHTNKTVPFFRTSESIMKSRMERMFGLINIFFQYSALVRDDGRLISHSGFLDLEGECFSAPMGQCRSVHSFYSLSPYRFCQVSWSWQTSPGSWWLNNGHRRNGF